MSFDLFPLRLKKNDENEKEKVIYFLNFFNLSTCSVFIHRQKKNHKRYLASSKAITIHQ